MKYWNIKNLFFLLFVLLTFTACKKDSNTLEKVTIEPGTPAYFYEQGLNAPNLEEKLRLYNAGLEAVSDKGDTNLVALLDGKIYALFSSGDYELSEKWIDTLLNAAEYQKDTFYLTKAYYRKSRLNAIRNETELEFKNAFIARKLSLSNGNTYLAARRSFDMATAQLEMGDYLGSQESAAVTLKYLNPTTGADSIFMSAAYNLIGLSYMNQGFPKDAIKEYRNALKYSARVKDSLTFLHNIALTYKNEERYDDAIAILESIATSKAPDSSSKSRILDNLAYTRWLKDSTEQVDTLMFRALQMRKLINDVSGLSVSYSHLADYYENKDKEEALRYATASLEAARKYSSASLEVAALRKLISLVDGKKEKKYVERYIFLHDSIDDANLKAKNFFAKIRFDEQKKQEEINNLEQLNFKQALEAERLQNRNLLTSFGIVGIFLGAVLLLYYSWHKSKREKLREIYRTEKRISKRIHDELANDVYDLMTSEEHKISPEATDRLAKIYYRTRDISRENNEIHTGENYLPGLVAILSSLAGNSKIILKGEKSVDWQDIAEEKKIVIYRVLQELLVNMKKHSKAQHVAVSFSASRKWLEINYKDTGVGCNPACLTNGNGIKNIKSRIASVNGKTLFDCEEGKGLQVNIRIPV